MRHAILALALVLPASSALADAVPQGMSVDRRVRYVEYDPNQVYTVYGQFRHALEIEFNPGETITQAALGDTISWEIVPVHNIIFLKPRERTRPTNLIVLTNYMGAVRSYRFNLIEGAGPVMYSVKFRYSGEEAARNRDVAMLSKIVAVKEEEHKVVTTALDHAVMEGKRNLNYWFKGDPALEPSEVSDNGEFTVMRFPGHEEIPSIFGVNSDGAEAIIDYDVREDYVVIHGVYKTMRLRKGQSVLAITNGAAIGKGRLDRTGTVSPVVERTVKPGLRGADGSAITNMKERDDQHQRLQLQPQSQQQPQLSLPSAAFPQPNGEDNNQ